MIAAATITDPMRKWCEYLARGGRLTRSGMFHCVTRNAGPITYAMVNQLEQAGLIELIPTVSDTPELRHMRAQLTPTGVETAGVPVDS